MKKLITLICITIIIVIFGSCSKEIENNLTVLDIFSKFQEAELPVGQHIVYDEDTDPNNLLGKSKQYIEKLNFEITTIEQFEDQPLIGGSIEIFKTKADAKARKDYIDGLAAQMPMLAENSFIVNDVILIRIDNRISYSEAIKYAEAIK